MKCGICHQPLESLTAVCSCGDDPHANRILADRYRLLGLVAEGGMGSVYRALRMEDDFLCVIKISRWSEALQQLRQLEPEQAKAEEEARIYREFKLLQKASSQSEHIVQVYDEVRDDPVIGLYYPMEFLQGQPLSQLPEWGRPLARKEVIELVLQMSEGISVAHGLGVVHRDLNPDNMFIVKHPDHDRFVKLIDFGIARDLYARKEIYNTGNDMAFGHLHYLAPEQVGYNPATGSYEQSTASKLDTRADIYTIGAIMFHMLTGFPPFDEDTIEGLALRDWEEPINVKVAIEEGLLPSGLRDIIHSSLHPDPNQRPPDIFVLSDMLRTQQSTVTTGPPPPPSQRKLQSSDFLNATSSSSDLWAVFEEGTKPGLGGLDQFSADFNNIISEQELADDIAEMIVDLDEDELPTTTTSSLPSEVLKSLDNAPAFFGDDDEESSDDDGELKLRSDDLKIAVVADEQLPPERSPQFEGVLAASKKQSPATPPPPPTKATSSSGHAASAIDALIAETLASAPLQPAPTPSPTARTPLVLWLGLGLGVVLIIIGLLFFLWKT